MSYDDDLSKTIRKQKILEPGLVIENSHVELYIINQKRSKLKHGKGPVIKVFLPHTKDTHGTAIQT